MVFTGLEGWINYPRDKRIHGLRARRIGGSASGNARVRLLTGSRQFPAGREIMLRPGVFQKEDPRPLEIQARGWGSSPADRGWCLTAGRGAKSDGVFYDYRFSPDRQHVLIHALGVRGDGDRREDLRFEVVGLADAVDAATGAVEFGEEWLTGLGRKRVDGKLSVAKFINGVRADVAAALPAYYACGICDELHPLAFDADCRAAVRGETRFAADELDARHGAQGWREVPMPGGEEERDLGIYTPGVDGHGGGEEAQG